MKQSLTARDFSEIRHRQVSRDVLHVSDGSLYPALHKLEQQGWITAEWKVTDNRPHRSPKKSIALHRMLNRQDPARHINSVVRGQLMHGLIVTR
jgi:DNA-binding PadR family transcriptional regulator